MGRRGGRKGKKSDSQIADHGEGLEVEAEGEERVGAEEGNGGFFACYLLHSLSPRYKGHTYIGYTVNPRRRIRQHNGEMRSGAWRTKRKRPWEMVLCVYGFPTNVSALQFEWAWQHPRESLAVRKAAADFKSLSGVSNKIRLAYTMLTLPEWESLNLTVNFFSTKYMKHTASCPKLSENMTTTVSTMDELPCYMENPVLDNDDSSYDDFDDGFDRYGDTQDHEETSSLSMEQSTQDSFMPSERLQSPIQAKECPQVQKQIQPDNIEKVKKLYFYSSEMPIGDDFPSTYDSGCNSYDETSSGDGFLASNSCSSDGSSTVSDGLPVGDASFGRHNFDLLDRNTSSIRSGPISSCNGSQSPKHDVIDLSTPPRCNFPSGKKQRSTGPQFIDLTESPLVIHL